MDNALATQLITVGATLGGVVLTLAGSALVERRRAHEAHRLESLRLAAEHTKWLRDERMKAYAAFSLASEEVQHFLRFEVPTAPRWNVLRADLRKAYNQVQLLGGDEPRAVALRVWLLGRKSADDLVHRRIDAPGEETADRVREVLADLGDETNAFLKACRTDLQDG